jgi:CRISPR-associated protein Cas5h
VLLDLESDTQQLLYEYLHDGKAEFLPYFGKNEFAAWWDRESFQEYDFQVLEKPLNDFKIRTLFLKQDVVKEQKIAPFLDFMSFWENETPFMYFERLPRKFDETLFQYDLGDSVFTTFGLKQSTNIDNLYHLTGSEYYVQLL